MLITHDGHDMSDTLRTRAGAEGLAEYLVSIKEYWNGAANERAMQDACEHAIETASKALACFRGLKGETK
jgi:hypothetical protein